MHWTRRSIMAVALLVALMLAAVPTASADDEMPPLPPLKRQASPRLVVKEHIDALNKCDWARLMAQYPRNVHFFLPDGVVVKGRTAVGELFWGFCKTRAEGGNRGLLFKAETTFRVGATINVQWVATADFLTGPYKGADAYVTKNGLMFAQVTTFGAPPLPYVE
jgi:hypothetical protein